MIRKLCSLAVIASIIIGQSASFAEDGNLWRLAKNKGSIKVFINEPVNEFNQGQIILDDFKKSLESAFVNRRSVKFEIVKTPEASDVRISSVIKKFQYMEKGPFIPTPGIATTLLDAAETMTANYAEIVVSFVVTSQSGEILWKDTLHPYVKKKMTAEASMPVLTDKVASHFMWKCFGKPTS